MESNGEDEEEEEEESVLASDKDKLDGEPVGVVSGLVGVVGATVVLESGSCEGDSVASVEFPAGGGRVTFVSRGVESVVGARGGGGGGGGEVGVVVAATEGWVALTSTGASMVEETVVA